MSMDDLPKRGEGVQCFDKEGNQITMRQWSRLLEDWDYKKVAVTKLGSGWTVSTVWLGLDHSFSTHPDSVPIIFETMCYHEDSDHSHPLFDDYQRRYSTLDQAIEGHAEAVVYARRSLELTEEELRVDVSPE